MKEFIRNKKIGKKLQFSFGAVMSIFVVTIAAVIICIMMINNKMENFYNKPYVNSVKQMEIRKEIQYAGKQILWAMTTDNEKETEEHLKEAEEFSKRAANNIEELKANFQNKEIISELESSIAELKLIE